MLSQYFRTIAKGMLEAVLFPLLEYTIIILAISRQALCFTEKMQVVFY